MNLCKYLDLISLIIINNKDKITATITSCKGEASGKPKFHKITKINQTSQFNFSTINFTTLLCRRGILNTSLSAPQKYVLCQKKTKSRQWLFSPMHELSSECPTTGRTQSSSMLCSFAAIARSIENTRDRPLSSFWRYAHSWPRPVWAISEDTC